MHQIQAGIAAYKGLRGLTAQNICPVFPGAPETGQITVVTAVVPVDHALSGVCQHIQHVAHQIQLQLTGFATGHIQLQILRFQLRIASQKLLLFQIKFFLCSAGIGCHIRHSPLRFSG